MGIMMIFTMIYVFVSITYIFGNKKDKKTVAPVWWGMTGAIALLMFLAILW